MLISRPLRITGGFCGGWRYCALVPARAVRQMGLLRVQASAQIDEALQEAPDKGKSTTDSGDGPAAARPAKSKGTKKADAKKAPSVSSQEDIRELRISKVQQLRGAGKEPYAYSYPRTHTAAELQQLYADLAPGEQADLPPGAEVRVAGRIMARRVMGKLAFLRLEDASGSIQLYLDKAALDSFQEGAFEEMKSLVDLGDIVGCAGGLRRTEKGELSVQGSSLQLLSKALRPLPDKWHGLTDIEKRYRQRYVDLIVTPGVRGTLEKRALMMSAIRRYLEERGFLEVETPVLESTAGGADARPFTTFHNALQQPYVLRIATELHLKRLIVGGFERVFEIGRVFRNEGVSARHNPEFTSVELYQAFADYEDMMEITEGLLRECAQRVAGGLALSYQGRSLDLTPPFRRASMHDLVAETIGVRLDDYATDLEGAKAAVLEGMTAHNASRKQEAAVQNISSVPRLVAFCFEEFVEKDIWEPTFVVDHPVETSPLAKPHRSRLGLVERFELFVCGRELANAYSELTDPVEQRVRLEEQVAVHAATRARLASSAGGIEADADYQVEVDEDFLTALEYGMPPTGGMGMGLDRLAMLLTDSGSIRDVIAFPLMRRTPSDSKPAVSEPPHSRDPTSL
eukprot:jgi/Botrbrau1/12114/Bobra.0186s0032.1